MPFLIGTDEAGYGPNLGPLVVSATLWHVAKDRAADNLYDRLSAGVSRSPSGRSTSDPNRPKIAIADSKQLYQAGGSLLHLERGVLAGLWATGEHPQTWRQLWKTLDPATVRSLGDFPWYAGYDCPLPGSTSALDRAAAADLLAKSLEDASVRLVRMRSAIVLPPAFNAEVARCDSKGALLSQTTLGLVARLLEECGGEPVEVVCDKHGGRNKYGPLLQTLFPDYLVEILEESRPQSRYRFGPREAKVQIAFRAKGEGFLPAALASMVCKYVRELAMQAENAFWQAHLPGLAPTAGYPEDARRFKAQIAAVQVALQIGDDLLWRNR